MPSDFRYDGQELDLFAQAVNWKRYFAAQMRTGGSRHSAHLLLEQFVPDRSAFPFRP